MITLPSSVKQIVIRLQGGLGNQMFQVAFGMAIENSTLAKVEYVRINEPLLKKSKTTRRKLDIRKFSSTQDLIVANYQSISSQQSFAEILASKYRGRAYKVIQESDFFVTDIQNCEAEVIGLDGYWQSEKYFANSKFEILTTFNSLAKIGPIYKNIARLIQQGDKSTIGIHVRRGDYIKNSKTNKVHGVCSLDYFENTLRWVKTETDARFVFIFSDDPKWAAKNLGDNDNMVISGVFDLNSAEELLLLSKCEHLILSNSSFSWWSAYLRENSPRYSPIVVAPDPWFSDTRYSSPCRTHWRKFHAITGTLVN
jgi:hypothetical protein